jgi:hypothetical protein
MKQIWVRLKEGIDPGDGLPIREPDFDGLRMRKAWNAVVGEPVGKHPDLPNFGKPLGDFMLVELDDVDADALEREAPEAIFAADAVPDDIRLITELTLCGPKPELKRFTFDEDKAGVALTARADVITADADVRARFRVVMNRMVAEGDMPEEIALRLAKTHDLEEAVVAEEGEKPR